MDVVSQPLVRCGSSGSTRTWSGRTLLGRSSYSMVSLHQNRSPQRQYPFYGSEEHAAMINALESAAPAAVIAVTGRYPALCGALDPFPLIEDGDFAIPTGNIRPDESGPVLDRDGQPARSRDCDLNGGFRQHTTSSRLEDRGPGGSPLQPISIRNRARRGPWTMPRASRCWSCLLSCFRLDVTGLSTLAWSCWSSTARITTRPPAKSHG